MCILYQNLNKELLNIIKKENKFLDFLQYCSVISELSFLASMRKYISIVLEILFYIWKYEISNKLTYKYNSNQ